MKAKVAISILFLQAHLLFSITATWVGPAMMPSGDWNAAGNWDPSTAFPNASGDIANLTRNPTPTAITINLQAAITVGTINFDSGTGYTIAPGAMMGSLIFNASTNTAITVTTTIGNGAHTITAPISLVSPLVVTQGSTGNFTISGAITNPMGSPQSLTKAGSGVLVLSGMNGYDGGTTINSGIISITADSNLGTLGTGVTMSNGSLRFDASFGTSRAFTLTGGAIFDVPMGNTGTVSGAIGGIGFLTKANAGILVLTNSNNYEGGTLIGGGTLSISNDNNLGSSSGTLTIASAILLTTSNITSSRSGSLIGAAVIDTGANVDVFSGNFSGTGSLTVQGGGTVHLTGTNHYSGGTFIATGTTLQGNTNGLQGTIRCDAMTSQLIFNQSFNGTYSGNLTSMVAGAGALTKTGTGTVSFTGNSSFSGTTAISQGTLNVDGSLASSSSVIVDIGATLSGSGTVGPTTNNGTISPGNSIDTLTINGALVLNSTSNVQIDLSPLAADRIAVTGMATIDGSLTITPTSGFYGFSACYTILTSSGLMLIPPGFDPVTSTNAAFVPTLSYSGTDVVLCVEILQPFAVFSFSNANTEAVGDNIDALFLNGQLSSSLLGIFDSLVGQSSEVVNDALDQMHPAQLSALTELQTEVGGQLISLFHRLPYLPCSCANPNRFWLEPFANGLTLKRHGMQIGSESLSGGIAFGYDGEIANNFIFGLGGAWNRNHLEWHDHRGHADANGLYGGLYSDLLIDQWYAGASILAGADFYETSRHIQFVTTDLRAKGEPMALDIMAQFTTAYLFGSPYAFFYPYANIDFLYLHMHKFRERGANGLNLTVQERTDTTLRTEMGLALQVQDTNAAETICISPQISIGWVNLCPLKRDSFQATFEGAEIPFTTHGWDITWNLLHVDFGLSFAYRCYSLGLEYNVEFSPDSHTLLFNQHGNLRLDWKW